MGFRREPLGETPMTLPGLLLATWTAAAPAQQPAAKAGQIYVNGRISRSLSGSVEIYEPWLRVNQWVNPWAGGASVSGSPLMGAEMPWPLRRVPLKNAANW